MEYFEVYEKHRNGIPPTFSTVKMKSRYYKWVKKNKLKLPNAEMYIKRITKELQLGVPEKIVFTKTFPNPLVTTAFWLYKNTTLTQKEISDIVGISPMTLIKHLKQNI